LTNFTLIAFIELWVGYFLQTVSKQNLSSENIEPVAPAVFIGQLDKIIQGFCVSISNLQLNETQDFLYFCKILNILILLDMLIFIRGQTDVHFFD
jgi:hypothetical protein